MPRVRSIALALGFAVAFAAPSAAQDQREIAERLDQLEIQAGKARAELDTLTGQIADLRRAIEAAPGAAPVPTKPSTEPKENVAERGAPPLEPEEPAGRGVGFFVRLLLLLVIVSAIFLISKTFFGRWNETSEEAAPGAAPAATDKATDEATAEEPADEPAAVAAEEPSESDIESETAPTREPDEPKDERE